MLVVACGVFLFTGSFPAEVQWQLENGSLRISYFVIIPFQVVVTNMRLKSGRLSSGGAEQANFPVVFSSHDGFS